MNDDLDELAGILTGTSRLARSATERQSRSVSCNVAPLFGKLSLVLCKKQVGTRMGPSPRLAVAFWAAFAAMIVVEELFFRPWMKSSEYFLLTAVFLSILALAWVFADAKENDLEVPKLLSICVVAAAFLAVPYYRFRYFGAKAGFIFLGIVAAGLAGIYLLAYLLEYINAGG